MAGSEIEMTTRDEYVASLKKQIDQWNAEITRWENRAGAAKQSMSERIRPVLQKVQAEGERSRYTLRLLEGASTAAWDDMKAGADEAFLHMQAAMKDARAHFEAAGPGRPSA